MPQDISLHVNVVMAGMLYVQIMLHILYVERLAVIYGLYKRLILEFKMRNYKSHLHLPRPIFKFKLSLKNKTFIYETIVCLVIRHLNFR